MAVSGMEADGGIPSLMEADGRDSFRWKLVETVSSTMRNKDEVTSSNKEFWVRIAKLMCSKEVLAIWKKIKKQVAQKAIAHIVNGDIPLRGADEDKNLSPLDWLMYDRFLVINCTDSSLKLFEEDITTKQQNTMLMIFHFVQKYKIEDLMCNNPAALLQAWWNLCVEYYKCGRRGSVMLLQWRWHMMKLATRSIFYKYWAGGARMQPAVENNFKPKPIHIAIAKRYPRVIVKEPHTWQQFLATDRIILPEQLEKLLRTKTPYDIDEPNEGDALVFIKPKTDTIVLLDDDDKKTRCSYIEQKVRTEVYGYANRTNKKLDVKPIQIEPNLGVTEHSEDYSKKTDSCLDSIRIENVQSIKVIQGNCEAEEAKTVDVSIDEDIVEAKCDEDTVIAVEDSLEKAVKILDMKEDIIKSHRKIFIIEEEVKENNRNLVKEEEVKEEEVNEEDEEDIIIIMEENNKRTNRLSEIKKDTIGSVISVQAEEKMVEENSISSSKMLIDVDEEVIKEESKEEKKKPTFALEEDIKNIGFCTEDAMYDNDVDLDEYQEDVEEVLDIDDVTLKSLERQHIAMKFDETHPVAAVSLDNAEEEIATSPNDSPSQKCDVSSFRFSDDIKLISDCVVENDELEDTKRVLMIGSEETNDLLVERSAVPVTCHAQKTQSLLTNICERTRKRKRRKKRHYEPDEILKNPDFEPKLLNLPISFYAIPENVRLLKACVPATVDVVADFTIADNDGIIEVIDPDFLTMYSEMEAISEQVLEPAAKKLNKTRKPKLPGPDIGKPTHILDRILNESAQMGEMQKEHAVSTTLDPINLSANQDINSEEMMFTEPVHKETLVRASQPICLPSISEEQKINPGIRMMHIAPVIPQNSMPASNNTDITLGEVLPIKNELHTPSLPQNGLPAKLVINKKGVSFISAAHPVKVPLKPKLKSNGTSPWYKPKPAKFEANLSMSSLSAMLNSLERHPEKRDGVKQKKKAYCCTLKQHNILNEARQRFLEKKLKGKPNVFQGWNIHKHSFADCDCCCKYLCNDYSGIKNVNNSVVNDDIDSKSFETSASKQRECSGDKLSVVKDNLSNLRDGDTRADMKGKAENVSTDQRKQGTYSRVLKSSESMTQKTNKRTPTDSDTQTSSDLAENISFEVCNINRKNQSSSGAVNDKKILRHWRRPARRNVVNLRDESDGSRSGAGQDSAVNNSIPQKPVLKQPPDTEIIITDNKSAEESLGLNIPKIGNMIKLKKTTKKTSSFSKSKQKTCGNMVLINLIDKLGLDSTESLGTSSLDSADHINYSKASSYIACDQMNLPKRSFVISGSSNKALHTINPPDIIDLQNKTCLPDYVTFNKGDDLKLIGAEYMSSTGTNEDVNLAENSQCNDDFVIDEGNTTVNSLKANNNTGVIDVSVLHETNGNRPVNILWKSEANSIRDMGSLELLPKSHFQNNLSQSSLFQNQRSIETNEVNEMSIPQKGSSILLDLMDQLGINAETVSGFNTNSTTENAFRVSDNGQIVNKFEQPVAAMKTFISNAKTVNTFKENQTELQEKSLLNYLGNKLNVVNCSARDTFTIINKEADKLNSEITLKKSHLTKMDSDSLLVKSHIFQKAQGKAKTYDFVGEADLQLTRKKNSTQLRSKARKTLAGSSDEDDVPLINLKSTRKQVTNALTVDCESETLSDEDDVPIINLKSTPEQFTDTLTVECETKTLTDEDDVPIINLKSTRKKIAEL